MRVQKLASGQQAYAEVLSIGSDSKFYAWEATINDILDVSSPDGSESLIGVRQGKRYFVLTIKNESIVEQRRVSKREAELYALI